MHTDVKSRPAPLLEYSVAPPKRRLPTFTAIACALLAHGFFWLGPYIPGAAYFYKWIPRLLYQSDFIRDSVPWACTFVALLFIRSRLFALLLPAAAMAIVISGSTWGWAGVIQFLSGKVEWHFVAKYVLQDALYNLPGFLCCALFAYLRTGRSRRHSV
jgi:hypothetical protein